MFENCIEIRSHFSDYDDGLCDRDVLRSLRFHLLHCQSCQRELEIRRAIHEDLRSLPVNRVPPEVSLRMRVMVSQHLHRNFLGHVMVFLENAIKPLMLPASAGVLTAIICFGLILGSQVIPVNWQEEARKVSTPPQVRALGPINLLTDEQALVLVTHVDAEGRVAYYQVLSGEQSPALMQSLNRMMNSSYFIPATMHGKPTDGQVVLSLRRITVRG
ncbi:MAG TPA: hypothetical protein VKV95_12935 [Terriglobia bacterium]|nr:hypothetical protein [Terriglobia bacterium]